MATTLERGTPGEARALCELSQRLAEEFGFTVSVQIHGLNVSVRFARRRGT